MRGTVPQPFPQKKTAQIITSPAMNSKNKINPDLTAFKQRGGKLLMYHGWSDQNVPPQSTINYYKSVLDKMGSGPQTDSWLRLFMAPEWLIAVTERVRISSIWSAHWSNGLRKEKRWSRSLQRTLRMDNLIAHARSAHIRKSRSTRVPEASMMLRISFVNKEN
jgi:Tannase and feruloyl esterase